MSTLLDDGSSQCQGWDISCLKTVSLGWELRFGGSGGYRGEFTLVAGSINLALPAWGLVLSPKDGVAILPSTCSLCSGWQGQYPHPCLPAPLWGAC